MPTLIAESGIYAGQMFAVGPAGLRIGRDAGNDIVLDTETVSGSHASLQLVGDQYQLHDHSTNGSWINGQKFVRSAVAIEHGDSILVGGHAFRFDTSGAQHQATRLETPAEDAVLAARAAQPVAMPPQAPIHPAQYGAPAVHAPPPAYGYAQPHYAPPAPHGVPHHVNVHMAPQVADYTAHAVITLLCYLFVYPVGLILNIVFLASGSSIASRTGESPVGTTFLWVLFILFFIAPLVVGLVFFFLLVGGLATL